MGLRLARFVLFGWFLFVLVLPAGLHFSGHRAQPIEERPLSDIPAFQVSRILDPEYYGELDRAVVDNNPVREVAIKAYSRMGYLLFGDVTGTQTVSGSRGWIFLRQTLLGDCIAPESFDRQMSSLSALGRALDDAGKPYIFLVAPDKEAIYRDILTRPQRELSRCRAMNRALLVDRLQRSRLKYIDAWQALKALRARTDQPVYHPLDTHWTEHGSTFFVEELATRFAPELSLGPLAVKGTAKRAPDLSRMAGMNFIREFDLVRFERGGQQKRSSTEVAHPEPGRPYLLNRSVSDGAPLSQKRVLFLHDSFMYVASDQVSQVFEDTFYMHWDSVTPDRFAALASTADAVVIQTVEREAFERLSAHFRSEAYANAVRNTTPEMVAEGLVLWPRLRPAPTD